MTRPGEWRDDSHDIRDIIDRIRRLELAQGGAWDVSIDGKLPTAPRDGRDFYYRLPNGGIWHFKFNRTTGVWDFVGGAPMTHDVDAAEGTTSTSYVDLTTDGPTLTLPFAGRYNFHAGVNMFQSGTLNYWVVALKIGSAAEEEWLVVHPTSGASDNYFNASRAGERDVSDAGTVCKLRYKVTGGTTLSFRYRFMHVTPIYIF